MAISQQLPVIWIFHTANVTALWSLPRSPHRGRRGRARGCRANFSASLYNNRYPHLPLHCPALCSTTRGTQCASPGNTVCVKMGLLNARSLTEKTACLNIFCREQGLHFFLNETWQQGGDFTPLIEPCPRDGIFSARRGLVEQVVDWRLCLRTYTTVNKSVLVTLALNYRYYKYLPLNPPLLHISIAQQKVSNLKRQKIGLISGERRLPICQTDYR